MKNGDVIEVGANEFGFTPINMSYKSRTQAQITDLPADLKASATADIDALQYATVTNGASGFGLCIRLVQVNSGLIVHLLINQRLIAGLFLIIWW